MQKQTYRRQRVSLCMMLSVAMAMLGCDVIERPADPAVGSEPPALVDSAPTSAACAGDPRVTLGLVSAAVCDGAELFFRGTFAGNGRTCGTCHPAAHNFTIDPAFIATLNGSNGNHNSDVEETLAALASNEVSDALADLSSVSGLNTAAQDALSALSAANVGLGSGMVFAMGPGSLMF